LQFTDSNKNVFTLYGLQDILYKVISTISYGWLARSCPIA